LGNFKWNRDLSLGMKQFRCRTSYEKMFLDVLQVLNFIILSADREREGQRLRLTAMNNLCPEVSF